MKAKRSLFLILGLILTIPLYNDCRRGENDPWLSFRSRTSRISAVWSLESGYINFYNKTDEEFNWLNGDCEEATNVVAYNFSDVKTNTYNFSNSFISYSQLYTTTRPTVDVDGQQVKGNEWEDANTIDRGVNYSFEITIKTNGTYRIYITYNLNETEFPNPPDDQGETQWGKTYSWTYEYTDNWHWQDDGLGTKSCIHFTGFPILNIVITAHYNLDLSYDYNYVSDVNFLNVSKIFSIDRLEHKNLDLISNDTENSYYQEHVSYEAYLGQDNIQCDGTFTLSSNGLNNQSLKFTSDGKNVDQ